MTKEQWFYTGDVNLECGGMFYQAGTHDDFAEVVKVTPTSDAGGPDNLFIVEKGSIYFGDWKNDEKDKKRMQSALDCCGWIDDKSKLSLRDRVQAIDGYAGLDDCDTYFVRVGKREDAREWERQNDCPDFILRARTDLRKWVIKEFDCDDSLPELPVIFRKSHHNKEWIITAFFPTLPADYNGFELTSYERVGQHGGASWSFFYGTHKCYPAEYADLLAELKDIYETGEDACKLIVYSRRTRQMSDEYASALKALRHGPRS